MKLFITTLVLIFSLSALASGAKGPCDAIKLRKKYHVYSPELNMRIGVIKLEKNRKYANEEIEVFSKVPFKTQFVLTLAGIEEEDIPQIDKIIKQEEGASCLLMVKLEGERDFERYEFKADKKKASMIHLYEENTSNVVLRLSTSKE